MPQQRLVVFDANDLLKLLSHYTEGQVPVDAELREFAVSERLQRVLGLWVASDDWVDGTPDPTTGGLSPLHIRYEGRRIMTIGNKGEQPGWFEAPESPNSGKLII